MTEKRQMGSTMKSVATALAALGATLCLPAAAESLFGQVEAIRASHMRAVEPALTPLAYLRFCRNNPAECRSSGQAAVVALDGRAMAALRRVNAAVNRSIAPQRRSGHELVETWSVMPTAGDCNDYAVSKRHALVRRGFPRSALLLAAAVTPRGESHLVLIVRTDQGDLVLDNLREDIRSWDATGYRWVKRESAADPMLWEQVAREPAGRGRLAALETVEAIKVASDEQVDQGAQDELRLAAAPAVATGAPADEGDPVLRARAAAEERRRATLALRFEALSMPHWRTVRFGQEEAPAFGTLAMELAPPPALEDVLAGIALRGTLSVGARSI